MTTKIQNKALEYDFANGVYTENLIKEKVCNLLRFKIVGLNKGMIIPDNLIAEVEDFMRRNANENNSFHLCPRCLKAHIVNKANEFDVGVNEIRYLTTIIDGEVGHDGYYLDSEELRKIN